VIISQRAEWEVEKFAFSRSLSNDLPSFVHATEEAMTNEPMMA